MMEAQTTELPSSGLKRNHNNQSHHHSKKKKKTEEENNRRFSDEQIKSLESVFRLETKLEPRKKLELARELGLQPRQVAIWFQNRRARWKSKQIEQEYRVLKANYDSLNSRFESLKDEKRLLILQLQKLNDLVKNPQGEGREIKDSESEGKGSENCLNDIEEDRGASACSDEDEREHGVKFEGEEEEEEETEEMNFGEESLASAAKWCNFDSGGLFDQTYTTNWWESWA